jgi:hypothetical protein
MVEFTFTWLALEYASLNLREKHNTAHRINQDTGTRRDLFPAPRWHQLLFKTLSSQLAFLQSPFPAFLYTITKVLAIPMLHQHHHARPQEEARSDCEAGC